MDEDGDGTIDETFPLYYDGTAEAEKITNPVIPVIISSNSRGNSGGALIINEQKHEPVLVINKIINSMQQIPVDNVFKSETPKVSINKIDNLNKSSINEVAVVSGNIKNQDSDKKDLTASVVNTKMKLKLPWPVIIIFSFALILLAKRFIKV
jgi:hypothetical protein